MYSNLPFAEAIIKRLEHKAMLFTDLKMKHNYTK